MGIPTKDFYLQRAFRLREKEACKKGLERVIMYKLYKDAKDAFHKTLTDLLVSYTLCRTLGVKRWPNGPCPQEGHPLKKKWHINATPCGTSI